MVFLILFYFFIIVIRFYDDIFGESADTSQVDKAGLLVSSPNIPSSLRAVPGARELFQQNAALS